MIGSKVMAIEGADGSILHGCWVALGLLESATLSTFFLYFCFREIPRCVRTLEWLYLLLGSEGLVDGCSLPGVQGVHCVQFIDPLHSVQGLHCVQCIDGLHIIQGVHCVQFTDGVHNINGSHHVQCIDGVHIALCSKDGHLSLKKLKKESILYKISSNLSENVTT